MAPQKKKDDQLELLIQKRANAIAKIERIQELVVSNCDQLSIEELDCRLEIVETYFTQALEVQSCIEELDHAGENINSKQVCGELEDLYCAVKVAIRSLMKQQTGPQDMRGATSSKVFENLPKLKLPTFSGKYSEFQTFFRLFTTLVHNEPRLTKIEKFSHLSSCLTGSALRTIKALDFTENNYEVALALLEKRFNNKYLMCQDHIKELFRLSKVQKGSAEQLRFLLDTVSVHFNSLSSLLSNEEIANALIVHLAVLALDSDSLAKVDEAIDCSQAFNWADCVKILSQRCQVLETRETKAITSEQRQNRFTANNHFDKTSKSFLLSAVNNFCSCCRQNNNHPLWKCSKYLELSPIQRYEHAKRLSLCINCLSSEHGVRQCKSSSCKYCKSLHHSTLHRDNATKGIQHVNCQQTPAQQQSYATAHPIKQQLNTQPQQWHQVDSFSKPSDGNTLAATALLSPQQQLGFKPHQWHSSSSAIPSDGNSSTTVAAMPAVGQQVQSLANTATENSHTILATALVEIVDKHGNKQLARALLDSASQLNFITQAFAQTLKLEKSKVATIVGGIGQAQTHCKFTTTASINSRVTNFKTSLQFLILPSITGPQPCCKIDTNVFNFPQNINLADPQFHVPQRVDLLIGADLFFELFDGKQFKLGANCPTLISTKFGWIVSGRCKSPQVASSLVTSITHVEPDQQLNELVQQFWAMEQVPEAAHKWSKEQEDCENYFIKTLNRLDCGRFEVRLPFKEEPTTLGDSKQMALKRFYSLERRLSTDLQLKQDYTKFLEEYEADGHMNQISWPTLSTGYYVMPHHAVLRPEKSTTKCRVVFDASAKSTNNISLNDILSVGPVVQNDLVNILWRFRLHQYGLMADITAMYRQIRINPEDCKVQNIIWRSNPTENLKWYRLNTVTYGTASAPYLATRCLVQLANECEQQNVDVAKIIKHDFYVDDLITGGSSFDQIQQIKTNVTQVLLTGGFQLHKWYSNHHEFLLTLSESEREKVIKINSTDVVKTLGVIWDARSDMFRFNYKENNSKIGDVTKRKVLSELSKLFDPLGLIKPIIVKAKIFLQELWLKKLDWDEVIPNECANAWIEFSQQLANINNIQIPRYVLLNNTKIQLHGFADASTRAYGCCFYIRCVDAASNTKVSLLTSRSKVSPISTVRSLPCLELCGAHLMTQLFQKIRTIVNFDEIFFWLDSIIVLQWLAEHASNFNTFVANRVSFVQEHTASMPWRYVPSGANPADLISRGTTVDELNTSIWFSGPNFLSKSIEYWPQSPKHYKCELLPERKSVKTVLLVTKNEVLEFINSRSNFMHICTTVAYIRRFIRNCRNMIARKGTKSIRIIATELTDAFSNIIVIIQQIYYASEILCLERGKQVHQNSKLKSLNPFMEAEGNFTFLKVGGRLKNANLPYISRCPVILPKNIPFLETYVSHLHITNFHIGAQALLNLIQQNLWIIGAREYTRKIVKRCIVCFKYRPKLLTQIMGNLPQHRVNPVKPFTHCGVDFCGPIVTTTRVRGKPKYKSYIAVFVCFVTRAVHLEVVSDLTADAFIAALKRFIGRRGLCTTIYCDNATNFVGARNQLKEFKATFTSEWFQQRVVAWCATQQITFKHIPPKSPHFGGIWEAAVKSAKSLLFKSMQAAVLTFEELTTVVVQIEGILNSRPLTAMSNDPSDERVLTPAHFLNQSRSECIAEPAVSFKQISLLKTWQQITAIQQHFWNRWSKEYLLLMQQRRKWTKDTNNIQVGALVMVHEDNLPPQKWTIGRIINVVPGADGKIRVVDVKTQSGIIRRTITKLAVLPVETS